MQSSLGEKNVGSRTFPFLTLATEGFRLGSRSPLFLAPAWEGFKVDIPPMSQKAVLRETFLSWVDST